MNIILLLLFGWLIKLPEVLNLLIALGNDKHDLRSGTDELKSGTTATGIAIWLTSCAFWLGIIYLAKKLFG